MTADAEMLAIDRLEDAFSPVDSATARIRSLISAFELCHHKAERWAFNIIEAIGRGDSAKGLGTRPPKAKHPTERIWQNACAALSAWCAGCPADSVELIITEHGIQTKLIDAFWPKSQESGDRDQGSEESPEAEAAAAATDEQPENEEKAKEPEEAAAPSA